MGQCMKCKYVIKDKERDIPQNCDVSKKIDNPFLLSLGKKDCCPYHEYPEYYGMK